MSVSLVNQSRLTRLWHDVTFYRVTYSYYADSPAPTGGDSVSMGNIGTCDRMQAELVAVPVTGYSDYSGGSCERSNYRSLIRDYGESTFVTSYGGYGSAELLLPMCDGEIVMPDDDESDDSPHERMTYLVEILTNLAEQYPLYDEEDESALVTEAAWESWDQWLGSDVRRDLADGSESYEAMEDMLDELPDDDIRQMYYRLTSELGNEYPYMESGSDSIYFPDHKVVIEAMAAELWAERCKALPQVPGWFNPDQLTLI